MTDRQLTTLVNLPSARWLLSMAVRRVCSKMASRSNVRAFLPWRNKNNSVEQQWTQSSRFIIFCSVLSSYWLDLPNPENPITDEMSPSPLILPTKQLHFKNITKDAGSRSQTRGFINREISLAVPRTVYGLSRDCLQVPVQLTRISISCKFRLFHI